MHASTYFTFSSSYIGEPDSDLKKSCEPLFIPRDCKDMSSYICVCIHLSLTTAKDMGDKMAQVNVLSSFSIDY
jgi:hypothetical protein